MKAPPKILQRILEAIKQSTSFCVVGHVRPDGDCIGSTLGLAWALRKQGYSVECWNEDPVPNKLRFLDPHGLVTQPKPNTSFDCVIAVDAASYERLGSVVDFIQMRRLLINIDHHPSNTRYGDINWIASRTPSSGELIYRLLKAAKYGIDRDIANCLFTAISTDTGSFQYPTTQPSTYQIAGELVGKGADLATICDEVYQSYSLSRIRLLRRVYNQYRLAHQNQIAFLWLKKDDYTKTGATREDTEGLIDHIRAIKPVIVACVFEEIAEGETRISLRSKSNNVDVNAIAKLFGGGGHKAAAGARVEGTPMTIQRRVVAAIRAAIDAASDISTPVSRP